ncbi:hypothetical protein UFOVP998_12 [uncultured Caudovirales phage]|uniref:Uncharacterized protein n=1 Tax=uncultured Caudovirales phage TaxID=2100421 RepID=A0A6J5PZ96_9CAUD|nr:hypothetical protein UFOVP998_12 [uncultured Caudovirales phage]CAB4199440.1 hypothetical protein UFOVP1331_47 [uncultured Caudovirales phage]CAB4212827.1 hypothetical protein UFOVP1442_28 [uncultured Caudovirales phage]CAB5228014.1 hypothetical protein UFOVP1535_23 [uncultured Caudovirales phage]
MPNLLLFRRTGLAIGAAAVLTLSAGDVTLKLNPAQSAWPNLLFRTIPNQVSTEVATLTLSAADPTTTQDPVTVTVENAALTLSATDPELDEIIIAENAALTLSAQDPALVPGAVTITAENALFTLSAADAGLAPDLRKVLVYINGTNRSALAQLDAQSLEQQADDHVGSFAVVVDGTAGFVPTQWMEVQIYQGSVANIQFGGIVQRIELVFPKGDLSRCDYRLHCVGFEPLFNRVLIFARYQGQSATDVGAAIVAQVPGFTAAIQGGLPTIDDLDLPGIPAGEALALVATKIGATSYIGPDKRAHLALVETSDAPDPLDSTSPYRDLQVSRDSSQVRNRVYAHGKGHPVTADVAAGSTTLPVRDVDEYPTNGLLLVGSQTLTHSGKSTNAGQGSTTNGPLASPTAPSSATVPAVSAAPVGTFRHAVSHVIEGRGETELSSASAAVTVLPLSPPVAGSGVVQNNGSGIAGGVVLGRSGTQLTITAGLGPGGLFPGARVRFAGTAFGAYDGTYTIDALDAFGRPVINGVSTFAPTSSGGTIAFVTAGPHTGSKTYRMTYENGNGTTLGGTTFSALGATAVTWPSGWSGVGTPSGGGALTPGQTYTYWIGWMTDRGLAAFIQIATVGMGSNTAVDFSGSLPVSNDPRTGSRVLFRSRGVGDQIPRTVATLDATSTSYRDVTADSALGALPQVIECGSAYGLFSLPVSADPRVTRRGLYRFDVVTGLYKRLASLDNVQTWFFDNVADAALGEVLPSVATFGGMALDVTVSSVPAGTTSTKVWRTKDGGSALYLVGSITAAGVFRDTRADADLVEPAPTTSFLTTLPGATSLRVKSTTPFTSGGWGRTGSQVFFFTGVSGDAIVGIPASGPGSLTAPVSADAEVVIEPHLRGVTGMARVVTVGETARIRVMVQDTAAQAALASGSDTGVREHKIENSDWSYATCLLAAQADLALNKNERIVISFKRDGYRDVIGKTIPVNLPSPVSITSATDFTITNVAASELGRFRKRYAERTVTISNAPLLTFDDYLRRLLTPAA